MSSYIDADVDICIAAFSVSLPSASFALTHETTPASMHNLFMLYLFIKQTFRYVITSYISPNLRLFDRMRQKHRN